jgi:hypothetical protein
MKKSSFTTSLRSPGARCSPRKYCATRLAMMVEVAQHAVQLLQRFDFRCCDGVADRTSPSVKMEILQAWTNADLSFPSSQSLQRVIGRWYPTEDKIDTRYATLLDAESVHATPAACIA